MSTVRVLQHLAAEPLGIIGDALEARGIHAECVRVFAGERIPAEMSGAAGLVVMGGSMGVYEQHKYPFLADEVRLIEAALRAEKPVLGICLGSELLASALGAAVGKSDHKEIGWFPVTLTEAADSDRVFQGAERLFSAYHWHGDVFDLPDGAVSLAASDKTQCQAFSYGENAYGILFHLEATQRIIEDMVRDFDWELDEEQIDSATIIAQTREHLPELQRMGASVFRRWVALLEI